ncbi:hypothetical protein RAZWK3B_19221 [Roseobacter sp. AzwK-3b]|nr:hypothetical protein RAZWK3B_19221 [Roseobacter sp. AzwK-3b]
MDWHQFPAFRNGLTAALGTREEPRLSAQVHAAQGAFGRIIRQADTPVIEECREGLPTTMLLKHVVDRLGHLVVPGEFRALCQRPVMEAVHQKTRQVLGKTACLFPAARA